MSMLLTYKLGMMSVIDDQGFFQPVTILQVKPNFITQLKTNEKDGYNALQIATEGAGVVAKPQVKHLQKSGLKKVCSRSREIRVKAATLNHYKAGQEIGLEIFKTGDRVNVCGLSKGKGFAGTIKRHNFSRQPKTHGGKSHLRRPGSIGSTFPQKVVKGKKMAGQMGFAKVTVKGLRVELIDKKRSLIGLKGAVPGPRRGLVVVKKV